MQASNFGGLFDQIFLWIFYEVFTKYASLLFLYHGAKKLGLSKKEPLCSGQRVQLKSHGERIDLSYIANMNQSVTGLTRWYLLSVQRKLAKYMPEKCALVENLQTQISV